ncbi:hypothetical protein ACIBCN_00055 [Nocardia sp. NPDC051052]|uniref:hypothetical protein n=1 Tax=Nocardia sp. NPDC051052 TaxID=3364322 RepID=UPI0037982FFE
MGSVGVTHPLVSAARIARFTAVMYKPHYLLYGVLWVLALEGMASLVTQPDSAWRPTWSTVVRIVVVAFVLLYLRMVDEQKDLEYDRVHNPDRPLVTGAVSAVELRVAMGLIAIGAISASLALSVGSAVMIAVAMAYGLVLWGLERLFAVVRTNILVNLIVTYPVQLLVTGYIVVSAIDTGEVRAHWQAAAVAGIFAGAFLQFEFARKTSRERRPDESLYSNVLGAKGSIAASVVCAVAAVLCNIGLIEPWNYSSPGALIARISPFLLTIPVTTAWNFRRGDRVNYPVVPAVVFILALYLTLIAQALTSP